MVELPLDVGESVQQLLQVAHVAVGEQPELVVAGDPGRVVDRRVEDTGRRPPQVHPGEGRQRRAHVAARRGLGRVPPGGRDPSGHPLQHQRAGLRVGGDQPRHPGRRTVPHERAVCRYFVPEALRPRGRVVQQDLRHGGVASGGSDQQDGTAAASQHLYGGELGANPLHRGDGSAQLRALGAGQVESPAERMGGARRYGPPGGGEGAGAQSGIGPGDVGRPGRCGHGGRC